MGKIVKLIKSFLQRRGTRISPFAVLHDVTYDTTTAIKPLAKLERSNIGKCTYIGTMAAVYDSEIGSFCSIAREAYVGRAKHPIDWVTTSPCFHLKNNATGVCYAENPFEWKTKPARFIRKRFADETIEKLEKIQWWNFNDSELEQLGYLVMNVDKFLEKAER